MLTKKYTFRGYFYTHIIYKYIANDPFVGRSSVSGRNRLSCRFALGITRVHRQRI
jgi:hypothetical protein